MKETVNKLTGEKDGKNKNFLNVDEETRLFFMLLRVNDIVLDVRKKELSKQGLLIMHTAVIFVVKRLGDQATPGNIAKILYRKPHSISVLLDRMEKKGLVKKSKASDVGNRIIASLTPQGEKAFELARKRESIKSIFSVLTQTQRKQMHAVFKKLWKRAAKELQTHSPSIFPFD